jgi:GNAT superfamily N-acetyltransferase
MGDAPGGREIREARASERRAVSACLSRAFEDDPIARFIFPSDRTRLARLASFYREMVRMMSQYGVVYTDPALNGASVWRLSSAPRPRGLRVIRDGLGMLLVLRGEIRRAMLLEQIVGPARPREPHWYLAILGTDPEMQGRGVGSSLLWPVLQRCDADRLPAYLESSKTENIPFYERHGFRVTRELRIPEGPSLWTMLRSPGAPLNRERATAD